MRKSGCITLVLLGSVLGLGVWSCSHVVDGHTSSGRGGSRVFWAPFFGGRSGGRGAAPAHPGGSSATGRGGFGHSGSGGG